MFQPKRVKYRKVQRGRRKGVATTGATLAFGEWGLKTMENAWLTARQIEAARRAMTHHMKRGGQLWIRVYPDKPVSKKPAETRQGGGKGDTDAWVAVVRRGRILFELGGVRSEVAQQALRLASDKLPVPTRVVSRTDFLAGTAG